MRIRDIKTLVVDSGIRPLVFVKVETHEGIVGWGECSPGFGPNAVVGAVEDLRSMLTGSDLRAYEMRFWDMHRICRHAPLGVRAQAIAGIELALLDIKARAKDMSVVELLGGPTRNDVRLYWSHCGTTRARIGDALGTPPLRSLQDIADLGREVVRRGFTALKTNIIVPGEPPSVVAHGFSGPPGTTDGVAAGALIDQIEAQIATFREAVGPHVDIILDLNFNFKAESCQRIAKRLEPYGLLWLEMDNYCPDALRQIKDSTDTRIATGECLIYSRDYLPYFQARCADVFLVDVPWNGIIRARQVAEMAQVFDYNVSPHNYLSHLSTYISASLCAVVPNVRIMEIDIDNLPMMDEIVTKVPEIEGGYIKIPTGMGWGTEINEDVALRNPWKPLDKYDPWKQR